MARDTISLVSFDLQGTLTDLAFSTCFWEETLPALVAQISGIAVIDAAKKHYDEAMMLGTYDPRFYSIEYWLKKYSVPLSAREALARTSVQPRKYPALFALAKSLQNNIPMIVVSSAAHAFVDSELGMDKSMFQHVFSSIDDFGLGGKPPTLYQAIADRLGVPISKILHIGDDAEMDQANAERAGAQTCLIKGNDEINADAIKSCLPLPTTA